MDWFQYFMKRKRPSLTRLEFDEDMVSLAQVESGSPFANSIWHMDTSSPSELFWNPTCASLNGTSLNPGRLLTWRWRRVHSLGASAVKRLWKNSPLLPFPNLILLVPTVIPTVRFFQFFTWETPSPFPPHHHPPFRKRAYSWYIFPSRVYDSHIQRSSFTAVWQPQVFPVYILGFLSVASTPPSTLLFP